MIPDGVKGNVEFAWSEIDDFIIARSDGSPTYNLVVAIDDALMNVSHVIRGDDHLSNTPKQIAVYQALGFTVPKFYHVPMIHNENGKKLSKRDGAMDVMEYKRNGYIPQALLNFLVRLGWSNKDQEIFTFQEMLELFSPDNINKSASAYNLEKLDWLNSHYIKNMSNEDLMHLLSDFDVAIHGHDKKEILLDNAKERAKTIKDLAEGVKFILEAPAAYDEKDLEKSVTEETPAILNGFVGALEKGGELHLPVDYQAVIDAYLKEGGYKMPMLGKPLRLALFGVATGPNLADVLAILGVEETKRRVEALLKNI